MEQLMMPGPIENPVWLPREWIIPAGLLAPDPVGTGTWSSITASHAKCEDCLRAIEQWLRAPQMPFGFLPTGATPPGLARRAEWERTARCGRVKTLHCEGHRHLRYEREMSTVGETERVAVAPDPGADRGTPHDAEAPPRAGGDA